MKGFVKRDWYGKIYNLPFIVLNEYWSLWVNPARDMKLKITKWLPINSGEFVHEGYVDSFGWLCYSLHVQYSIVPLERYQVRILPGKMSLRDYEKLCKLYKVKKGTRY